MQSFYRRFVRDYMRYKDEIQCAGHTLVQAVRAEALSVAPHHQVVCIAVRTVCIVCRTVCTVLAAVDIQYVLDLYCFCAGM